MKLYEIDHYKVIIRGLVSESRLSGQRITLKRIAAQIRIQYTYLSKALNDPKTHLGEDHLHSICRILGLLPDEIDYVFLLRSRDIAQDPVRRKHLEEKLSQIRAARALNAAVQPFESRNLGQEMAYLFDPFCLLVAIGLTVPSYLQDPRRLGAVFGINADRLREVLQKLAEAGVIELEAGSGKVGRMLKPQFHYGPDHPMIRAHQAILRDVCSAHLSRISDDKKRSFMATFTGDENTFVRIQERFQEFIREAEKISAASKPKWVMQLNFDFFGWE